MAYQDEEINFIHPPHIYKPVLSPSDYSVKQGSGMKLVMSDGKLKVKSSYSRSGKYYTCTLSYKTSCAKDKEEEYMQQLTRLYYGHYHLLVKCLGGSCYLIRSSADTFLFLDDDNEGSHDCEITIQNTSGAQIVRHQSQTEEEPSVDITPI